LLSGTFADINLRYNLPNDKKEYTYSYPCPFDYTDFDELEKCYKFSAAVAMFGSILRSSPFTKNVSWNELLLLAESSSSEDLLQKEFITIIQQAKTLYSKVKKKKGDKSER